MPTREPARRSTEPNPPVPFAVGDRGLSLIAPLAAGPATLTRLELGLSDPDATVTAAALRDTSSDLRRASITAHVDDLQGWLATRFADTDPELKSVELRLDGGRIEITAEVDAVGARADVLLRAVAWPADGGQRFIVSVGHLRVFGALPVGAPTLATALLRAALAPPGQWGDVELIGATAAVIDPLPALLSDALGTSAWRPPRLDDARLLHVEANRELRLEYRGGVREADVALAIPRGPQTDSLIAAYAETDTFAEAELAIAEGRSELAIERYLTHRADHPQNAFVHERILQLAAGSVDDGRTLTLADATEEQLGPFVPALLARASVALRRGELVRAADAFVDVAEIAADRGDGAERILALLAAVRCLADVDPKRARAHLDAILADAPHNSRALRALAELFEQSDDAIAADHAERWCAAERDPRARAEAHVELLLRHGRRADGAADARRHLQALLGLRFDHARRALDSGDLRADLVTTAARVVGDDDAVLAAARRTTTAPETLELIADIYRATGATREAEDCLLAAADLGYRPRELMARAAALARLRDDPDRERSALARLFRLGAISRHAGLRLAELQDTAGDAARAARTYLCVADGVQDRGERRTLLRQAARAIGSLEPDNPRAATLAGDLCAAAPDDPELADAVERVMREGADPTTLHAFLCKRANAPLGGEPAARARQIDRLCEIAEIEESLRRRRHAARTWGRAHEIDPDDLRVAWRLIDNLIDQGAWDDAARVMRECVERDRLTPQDAAEIATRLGCLYLDELNDPDVAIRWLRYACDHSLAEEHAFQRLLATYRARGAHVEIAALLEERLRRMPTGERALVWIELAHVREANLDDARGAADAYAAAFRDDPQRLAADARRAAEMYLALDLPRPALRLADEALSRGGADDRTPVQALRGDALAALGRMPAAAEAWRNAIAGDGASFDIHAKLGQWLASGGDERGAIRHLQIAADRLADPERAAASAWRAGTCLETIGLTTEARRRYTQAISIDPALAPAHEALAALGDPMRPPSGDDNFPVAVSVDRRPTAPAPRVSHRTGYGHDAVARDASWVAHHESADWEPLAEPVRAPAKAAVDTSVIRKLLELEESLTAEEPDQLADVRQQLGALRLRAGDLDGARSSLLGAIELDGAHLPAMRSLLALYDRADDPVAAVRLLERVVQLTRDPLERAKLLYRRAELLTSRLGDDDAAVECLLRGYDLTPEHAPTLWRLVDHYWGCDELAEIVELGRHLAALGALEASEPDDRPVRVGVARLVADDDFDGAVTVLHIALSEPDRIDDALSDLVYAIGRGVGPTPLARAVAIADTDGRLGRNANVRSCDADVPHALLVFVRELGHFAPHLDNAHPTSTLRS